MWDLGWWFVDEPKKEKKICLEDIKELTEELEPIKEDKCKCTNDWCDFCFFCKCCK